ncbi:MAG TPA: fused MFS/spermidine synthase [Verrucomicrobiae bacterium]
MKLIFYSLRILGACLALTVTGGRAEVVFEATSPYHHIRVLDEDGMRMLSFDGTRETRMSLNDPLQGHFEYTEYFHMPWLWNTQLTQVLMIGLGGASAQRSFQHYYPQVEVETAELDPLVVHVAREHFNYKLSATHRVRVEDGRVHLRRSSTSYDAILVDAYVKGRYGSSIPYHLATKEFFDLANQRLATNGVLAYNVIGTLNGWQADILGSLYKTLKAVFPQVYLFPASTSQNVVLIAVKSDQRPNAASLRQRADALVQSGRIKLPTFRTRLQALRLEPPASFKQSKVLTDDFAPVDGMLTEGR